MKVKKNNLIAILLGVLVIVSMIQAFQLTKLKTSISEGGVSVSSSSSKTPAASGGDRQTATLPSSIKDLPQMVGGC